MAGLPKIALARLKVNPKSSGPPLGPDAFQGGQHPDANLLAAFVEKTLTERERTQVLNHLSQCAECREVAAFTLPAEAVAAEPARVPARRRSSPWLVLRWSAMAVALGALTVVVVLHPGMWNGPPKITQQASPPAPAENIASAPPTVSAPPSAQPSPETAQAKVQGEARESADELAAAGNASGSRRDLGQKDHAARAKAKQQVTLMASSRPPATLSPENAPAVKAEREESRRGSAPTEGALPAPAPPPAPAAVSTVVSLDAAKASAEPQAGPALGATAPSVAVTRANPIAGSAEGAAAKVAARVSAGGALHMTAQAPMSEVQVVRKKIELGGGLPAALWSVSTDGIVQRSTDGGKTYEQIPVANGIKFRAIAALGSDVWTGGAGGALFHSPDGGATWNRAGISFEGNTVTETITDIQLRNPQQLTITTASGSQWASEDGGQHWQKQP
ncbi:MAG TPA: YCF48-related protein [Terriglobia bacterium]|nr:YCF48-related protein [Terriglobia bacterium]